MCLQFRTIFQRFFKVFICKELSEDVFAVQDDFSEVFQAIFTQELSKDVFAVQDNFSEECMLCGYLKCLVGYQSDLIYYKGETQVARPHDLHIKLFLHAVLKHKSHKT